MLEGNVWKSLGLQKDRAATPARPDSAPHLRFIQLVFHFISVIAETTSICYTRLVQNLTFMIPITFRLKRYR